MEFLIPIIIIFVLIALNGVFVAAEFAIIGVSRPEVERAARLGNRVARLVRYIVESPRRTDQFIATAQLGITAASLGLGMYGEQVLAGWIAALLERWGWQWQRWIAAHSIASVLAVAIMTYFHIVLGEMVPKSVALQRPHRTAHWIAPIVRAVQIVFYPIVLLLNGIGNAVLRLMGVRREEVTAESYRTPEELAFIVRESQTGGMLRKQSAQVIGELLEFGDHTAGEVMVPRVRVVGIPVDADPARLREVLRDAPHTRYPVYDGTLDNIVGMLHVRDLLRRVARGESITRAQIRRVPFVPETATTEQVLSAMRQLRTQMAVVMDELGGTAGIVTMEDLFEEVIGEITERPDEVPAIVVEGPDRVRADGTAHIEDVGAALGQVLEHEDVDTVSGLVLSLLGRPPLVGDVVVYDHVRFEVAEVRGNGVGTCVVTIPAPEQHTGASEATSGHS